MNSGLLAFKHTLDIELEAFLSSELQRYNAISSDETVNKLLEHQKVVTAGGKRIRPYLVYAAYTHEHKDAKPHDIIELLLAVELFHVFCLIHDDVMDDAAARHGAPTLQAFAETSFYPGVRRVAESQAILVGDILLNSVFRLLLDFINTHPQHHEVLPLFHTLIDEVCLGQMIDVDLTSKASVSFNDITEKNRLKTAYYSIVRPLQLGLTLAGRSDLEEFARLFGEQLGLLYQIQDDLLDVLTPQEVSSKPRFQDVAQNQHTLLRAFIEGKNDAHSVALKEYLGKPVSEADSDTLLDIFVQSGAVSYATECIQKHHKNAELYIEELPSPSDRAFFTGIMNLIYKRTH
jgi:geranylgeranyl diphosphate synthase, type I